MRKPLAALILSSLSLAAPLRAEFRSTWPFDGRFAAIDSQVPGRTAEDNLKSGGADIELNLSPILGWSDSRWLILPSLNVDSNSANTILKVDDERFEFLAQSDVRLELGTAFKRTPDQRFGIRAFGETFQAKQAANETLATGVYDYQDGGVTMDWRQKWDTQTPFRSTLGLTTTNRKYPNWQSLDPGQRSEKDQDISRLYTDLEWAWTESKVSAALGFSIQNADYVAAYLVDESGTTTDAKRKDTDLELTLDVPFEVGKQAFSPGLTASVWDSNLTNYDTQNNFFTPNYSDFIEVDARFGYAYSFSDPWAWGFFKSPQLTFDLDLGLRQYIRRIARQSDGSLGDAAERDFTRNVSIGFNSAYTDHWAFFTKFDHQNSASNNQDQSSALYNYTFNTFSLGVNFFY